jgi:hypothetical protein
LEKVGLFWKKPYFFFKRLKLDQLRKSRALSKKALLFPEKALLFRLKLRTLDFLKSLWGLGTEEEQGYRTGPPGYIGWRNSFLGINFGAP